MAARCEIHVVDLPERQVDLTTRPHHSNHYQRRYVSALQQTTVELISLSLGMRMPGWFDLANLDRLTDSAYDDEAGMMSSVAAVDALIQAEIDNGISEDRIVVGGFSQGGAVAILTAIVTKRRLAGVAALSTWVPLNHKVTEVSRSGV